MLTHVLKLLTQTRTTLRKKKHKSRTYSQTTCILICVQQGNLSLKMLVRKQGVKSPTLVESMCSWPFIWSFIILPHELAFGFKLGSRYIILNMLLELEPIFILGCWAPVLCRRCSKCQFWLLAFWTGWGWGCCTSDRPVYNLYTASRRLGQVSH